MPINAAEVTPPDVGGIAVAYAPTELPSQAKPVDPPAVAGVSAQVMPPVAAAGVKLACIVLSIAVTTIILLLGYLSWMDYKIGADVRTTYDRVIDPSGAGAEYINFGRLERLSQDLEKARADPALVLDAAAVENAQSVLKTVNALSSVPQEQKDQLKACIPPPTDPKAREALVPCLQILSDLHAAILAASSSAMLAGIANSAVDKLGEHREKFHAFWIQAAQLLLLNLLLPLLTALFGYIFGTQQAQRSSST